MRALSNLNIKLFADGAEVPGMLALNRNPLIQGMTTNPTLMRKAGITDYLAFARELLAEVTAKPVSFEVFAGEFDGMLRQAMLLRDMGGNVYVKVPIMNPRGQSAIPLIRELAFSGVKVNVTAVLTERQCAEVAEALNPNVPAVVSVFAGRIADTGVNPVPVVQKAAALLSHLPNAELLWASVREVYNIFQAADAGCHIVTVPHEILHKAMEMCGMDLEVLSLETVRMFDRDAKAAGFKLEEPEPPMRAVASAVAA